MTDLVTHTRPAPQTPSPTVIGVVAGVLILLGSFGGGATRSRGGALEYLGLEFMSFGHGAAISNVVLWIGTLLLIMAWVLQGKRLLSGATDTVTELTRRLWLWVAPLVLAAPIMSRDVYSYLVQGVLLREGFDPYTQGAATTTGPYLVEVSHDWRNTTTPYGPLHLWIGEGVTRIAGENVTAGVYLFKLISLLGFAAIVWAVPRIARQLGGDPTLALWLGVMNPVMIIHLIGGMHNESVMVGLVSVGLVLALRRQVLLGIAIIAVGMSLKATAAFALPFVVWIAVAHARRKGTSVLTAFFGYAVGGAAITVAVLAIVTFLSGASWGWIAELTGNSKVINPLAFPSLITGVLSAVSGVWTDAFPYNQVISVVRPISMTIMGLGMIACWWYFRESRIDAVRGTAAAYTVAFVFNSVTLPWYYASIISLVGTFKPPLWLQKLTTGLTIIITMAFTGSGNHQLYNVVWLTVTFIGAWWCVQWIFNDKTPPIPGKTKQ